MPSSRRPPPPAPGARVRGDADEGGQLQHMEADRIEEEEEESFESVDKLISQGINAGDVKKLQDAGIYTCKGLMTHSKKSLTGIKGLSEAKVEKIFEAAEKLLSQGFMTGSDLLIKESAVRISTGSQAIAPDFVTDMSKLAMSRNGGCQSWGLLHRVVLFVDPDAVDLEDLELDGVHPDGHHFGHDELLSKPSPIPLGVEFCIQRESLVDKSFLPDGVSHEKIPQVSFVIMNHSLLSRSSAHPVAGSVKCTDTAGNILIEVSQGPGTELLLVCRPGNGTAHCLPPVPGSPGVQNSIPSCKGTVSDPCGGSEGFMVVCLQQGLSTGSSSSHSPKVLHALCFASKDDAWSVKEVRVEQASSFEAGTVVSHSDGSLVFVDLDYGMLIFDTSKHNAARIVQFPGGTENANQSDRRCVASSGGCLLHVLVHDLLSSMPKITIWFLNEEGDQEGDWKYRACIFMDEIRCCSGYKDAGFLPKEVPELAFIHPLNTKKLFFVMPHAMFSIEVMPPEHFLLNNLHLEIFNKCRSSLSNLYPWVFPDPDLCSRSDTWQNVRKATKIGKRMMNFAWKTLKKNKEYMDKAPMAAECIGWVLDMVLQYPVTPTLRAGADIIKKIGQAIETGETACRILQPPSPKLDYSVVGTVDEARDAIKKWKDLGRPSNMVVDLDYELTPDEESLILGIFTGAESKDLLFDSGWEVL